MTILQNKIDCLFCGIAHTSADPIPWHDRPLAKQSGVGGVVAALGAFIPGYVLVFPDLHVESINRIPRPISLSFSTLVDRVKTSMSDIYGPVTIFEHGSCSIRDSRRSACITHAHLHIIPGSYRLAEKATPEGDPILHASGGTWTERDNYLFLREPGGTPKYFADPGVSQFFRRIIAGRLGIADQWDWLMFPELDNVRATIDRLQGQLL